MGRPRRALKHMTQITSSSNFCYLNSYEDDFRDLGLQGSEKTKGCSTMVYVFQNSYMKSLIIYDSSGEEAAMRHGKQGALKGLSRYTA